MSKEFFSRLSQSYINILNDEKHHDITIEVGEEPNVKIFRAHMIVLFHRSPFLQQTLDSMEKNNDGALAHVKFPDISPESFQVVLK
jgi:hypothetical protein